MGIATILHWNKFHHGHVAFWLSVLLYFTTTFLIVVVWLRTVATMSRPTLMSCSYPSRRRA